MRKSSLLVVCFVLVSTLLVPVDSTAGKDGLDNVPADVQFLITIRDLGAVIDALGMTDLRSERPDLFAELDKEAIDEIGFSPLDINALKELGLDINRPIYMGWVPDPTSSMVLMLPGKDGLLSSMKSLLTEMDEDFARVGEDKGVEIFGDDDDEVVFYHDKDFLVIVAVVEEDDDDTGSSESALTVAREFRRMARANSLAKEKKYQALTKKVKSKGDVQVYFGAALNQSMMGVGDDKSMEDAGLTEDEIQQLYDKWGMGDAAGIVEASITPDRISAIGYSLIEKNSVVMDWYTTKNDPRPFLQRVPSDPMIMTLSRINSAALYKSFKEVMDLAKSDDKPSLDEMLDDASKDVGVNIETALVDMIDGNIGLVINRAQLMGTDAMLLIQLADADGFYDTLDGLAGWIELALGLKKSSQDQSSQQSSAEMVEAEFGGVDYYKIVMQPFAEICFGIVEDHLIVTSSVQRFHAIIGGDGSFISTVGNKQVASTVKDPTGGLFYVNFEALVRDLQAMAPMIGIQDVQMFKALGQLSELTAVSRIEKGGMWLEYSLTNNGPDTWKNLIAWLLEESAEQDKETAPNQSED